MEDTIKGQSPTIRRDVDTQIKGMDFPNAMRAVLDGRSIARMDWGASTEYGLLKDGVLIIHRTDGDHTWIVSEADMKAVDWIVAKGLAGNRPPMRN